MGLFRDLQGSFRDHLTASVLCGLSLAQGRREPSPVSSHPNTVNSDVSAIYEKSGQKSPKPLKATKLLCVQARPTLLGHQSLMSGERWTGLGTVSWTLFGTLQGLLGTFRNALGSFRDLWESLGIL